MPVPLVSVHMACNDPDNGDFTGHVCRISLENNALELTAKAWTITSYRRCPLLRDVTARGRHVFYLSGKPWQYERRQSWVGNWCWEGFALTAPVATEFLVWLHGRGLFQCEGGWVELTEAWDAPELKLPDEWWKL